MNEVCTCVDACTASPFVTLGLCPIPPDGQTLSQGPLEVGALCLTACHCAVVVIFFFSAGDGV